MKLSMSAFFGLSVLIKHNLHGTSKDSLSFSIDSLFPIYQFNIDARGSGSNLKSTTSSPRLQHYVHTY